PQNKEVADAPSEPRRSTCDQQIGKLHSQYYEIYSITKPKELIPMFWMNLETTVAEQPEAQPTSLTSPIPRAILPATNDTPSLQSNGAYAFTGPAPGRRARKRFYGCEHRTGRGRQ